MNIGTVEFRTVEVTGLQPFSLPAGRLPEPTALFNSDELPMMSTTFGSRGRAEKPIKLVSGMGCHSPEVNIL